MTSIQGISSNAYYTYNPHATDEKVLTKKNDQDSVDSQASIQNDTVEIETAHETPPQNSAVEQDIVVDDKTLNIEISEKLKPEVVVKLAEVATKVLEVDQEIILKSSEMNVKIDAPKLAEETKAEKVQKIFNELLIKEWFLPGIGQGSQYTGELSTFSPVFSTETLRDLSSIRVMIEKSELHESAPIPNLVFVGKPGVGKTIAIQHLCETTGTPYVRIPSGAMEHHLKVSTAIATLHKIFDVVDMCEKPVYIVMDDGEELVAKRPPESKPSYNSATKAHWLIEKENFAEIMQQRRTALVNAILEESGKDRRRVGFAITTNRPQIIDKAFMTRARMIEFNKPEMEQRKQIIIAHLPIVFENDMKYLPFFHMGRLENIAQKTKGFTGRNLVEMLKALYACVQMEKGDLRQDMIDACICEQENAIKISDDGSSKSFRFPEFQFKTVANKLKDFADEQFSKIKNSSHQVLEKLTARYND